MAGLLKLRARDARDLETIAACVQDALVALADVRYLPAQRRFALMLNRFRWEAAPKVESARPSNTQSTGDAGFADRSEPEFERVHSVLTFERVRAVKHRGLEKAAASGVLSLLTLSSDDRHLDIAFADGGAIRLEVDQLSCYLEDLGESWPTVWRPRHSDDGPGGGAA